MEKVNASAAYQNAAKNWEGDLVFIVTAVPDERQTVYLYMDLWHGQCRKAYETTAGESSEFTIAAPLAVWRKVLEGNLDPIRGLVSRQLKLTGNLAKIMKAPKAATELVNACATINTEWPA
jgi:putative sterol carrier protein